MLKSIKLNQWLKGLSWAFLTLVLLLILITALLLSPMGIKFGVNKLNEMDAGISIDYDSGSLYSSIKLKNISVRQPGLELDADKAEVDLSLSCLWSAEVCINNIDLGKIKLALSETEAAPKSDTPISELITLPVMIRLHELSLDELNIFQNETLLLDAKDFALALQFEKVLEIKKLTLDELNYYIPKQSEVPEPTIAPSESESREWLAKLGNFKYDPITLPRVFVPIQAKLANTRINNICVLKHTELLPSNLYCLSSLNIGAQIKKQELSSKLTFSSFEDKRDTPIFVPLDVMTSATVNFADKLRHDIKLEIKPNSSAKSIEGKPKSDTPKTTSADSFVIAISGDQSQTFLNFKHAAAKQNIVDASLNLEVSQAELPVDIEFAFNGINESAKASLTNLLPGVSEQQLEPLIGVSNLRASVVGDINQYAVSVEGKGQQVMGVSNVYVDALISPKTKQSLVNIEQALISGDIGKLRYAGKVFVETNASLNELTLEGLLGLEKLDPSYLSTDLMGMFSGELPHTVTLNEVTQWASISDAAIDGSWQELPFKSALNLRLDKSGNIFVEEFLLNQSENVMKASGQLYSQKALDAIESVLEQQNFAAQQSTTVSKQNSSKLDSSLLVFDFDINSFEDIYPSLEGALSLQGQIQGAIETPTITLTGKGESIVLGEHQLDSLNLQANVDFAQKLASEIKLNLSQLYSSGVAIPQLELSLQGDEVNQSLSLDIPEGDFQTRQVLDGELLRDGNTTRWNGQWLEGRINTALAELEMQSTPQLTVTLQPFSLQLQAHCWRGRADELCVDDIKVDENNADAKVSLNYQIMNSGMGAFLTEINVVKSDLEVNVDAAVMWSKDDGVNFTLDLNASDNILVAGQQALSIEKINAVVSGSSEQINTTLSLSSEAAGAIDLESLLLLQSEKRTHNGKIGVSDLALSQFAPFTSHVQRLEGVINADLAFSGALEKPSLGGELKIKDAAVGLSDYPIRLSEYNQELVFDGFSATYDGQFKLGQGSGRIQGAIDFADGISASANISGDKLDIEYETYRFHVSPDMQINMTPELLSVTGGVNIPYARIKLKDLPPNAKSPNADILVVDEKRPNQNAGIPLDIDLNIKVDEQKKGEVRLDALDLKAELSGNLNVKIDSENTRVNGLVSILKGDYAAYGQVLQIRKGDISFSGQPDVPAFDIEAIRNPLNTSDEVIAGIRVSGNAITPRVALFSEPSMEQAEQLSYLISGTGLNSDSTEKSDSDTMLVNALVSFGVGQSESGLGSLGRKLGVKDLNLQTAGQGNKTQVQLSGQLAEGVKVTYGIGVFDSVSEVSVHYQLLPQLYLEAVSGLNSTLDLIYEVNSRD
ncbi:MAG: translocation/assembly module TamB domain-containing protein [Glaciecola sp.]|jgi:translocation and assembly module TamB